MSNKTRRASQEARELKLERHRDGERGGSRASQEARELKLREPVERQGEKSRLARGA